VSPSRPLTLSQLTNPWERAKQKSVSPRNNLEQEEDVLLALRRLRQDNHKSEPRGLMRLCLKKKKPKEKKEDALKW
jgi:hypothetical protein